MAANTAIQKPAQQGQSLIEVIRQKQGSFADVATKYLPPERLVKLAIVAITKMPDLQKVPAAEVVAELINCARLGLEPNVEGGRWLLPFKRRTDGGDRYELVAVTDYRGLVDIARRSGEVVAIHADVRRANDLWENWIDAGGATLVHLRHRRAESDRGDVLGAYAVVRLKNGEVQAAYLTLDEINSAKGRSRGASSEFSPWQRDFEAMAKKTAIRRLYNLLPKTPEVQAAREVLAEEEERDRAEPAPMVETVAPASRTEALKTKLRGAPATDSTLEPGHDPESMDREPGSEG